LIFAFQVADINVQCHLKYNTLGCVTPRIKFKSSHSTPTYTQMSHRSIQDIGCARFKIGFVSL